ncbi:DNA adenine methylase [Caballeronia sp. BR00000012568055]|uniref:DNA adenine methylase n=1 Tax=Caballeronia sp. BR00000012568055 TaxID=2918761 RepID=UPI0023F92F3F|nr:DNA adenine methylase [Caballeronia sp. BR00000012568055]
MAYTDSALRYPGGKTQLAPVVIDIMRANDLFYGDYVEPFAGGAGIAWRLLLNDYVDNVHINDLDPAIHDFWWSVLNRTDALCELIESTPVTVDEWHRQRAVQENKRAARLARGFSTFFLNRTNRSGIIRGGVIGGLEQAGEYKIDCRFNKSELIRKIKRIASQKARINLSQLNALNFLQERLPNIPDNSLVNLDPPYYVRGPELYRNHYTHDDHADLAQAVRTIRQSWMVTYDDTPQTRALYEDLPVFAHSLSYTAQVKRVGAEIVVLDPRLTAPLALADFGQIAA